MCHRVLLWLFMSILFVAFNSPSTSPWMTGGVPGVVQSGGSLSLWSHKTHLCAKDVFGGHPTGSSYAPGSGREGRKIETEAWRACHHPQRVGWSQEMLEGFLVFQWPCWLPGLTMSLPDFTVSLLSFGATTASSRRVTETEDWLSLVNRAALWRTSKLFLFLV